MPCALCLQDDTLECSHILPNAIFRQVKKDNAGKLISLDDSQSEPVRYSVDSWSEYLLCSKCEDRLSPYEKGALEALRGKKRDGAYLDADGIKLRDINYRTLKLFFTCLVWRAHAASIAPFSKVVLPKSSAEAARISLLTGAPMNPSTLGVRLMMLFDPTKVGGFSADSIKQLIVTPFPRLRKHFVSFVFVFEGYIAEFFVPQIPLSLLSKPGILKRSHIWHIPKKNIFEIPELLRLMVAGYGKSEKGLVTFKS